jgi:hypothetical protein
MSASALFDSVSGSNALSAANLFNVSGWVAVGESDVGRVGHVGRVAGMNISLSFASQSPAAAPDSGL